MNKSRSNDPRSSGQTSRDLDNAEKGPSVWARIVRQHAAACRLKRPIPPRETLSPEEEEQCLITGGSLIQWLNSHGPEFLRQRAFFKEIMPIAKDPVLVFTSNMPGLVAAQEILDPCPEKIVYLLESEYAECELRRLDPDYRHHVHFWSVFREPVDPEFAKRASEQYPLAAGACYWQHSEGTVWGEPAGRGVDHLWSWNGTQLDLLEEAFDSWIS
jgi:hypothetical protein